MPSRGKAVGLLVVVFVAGLLAGFGLSRLGLHGPFAPGHPRRGPDSFVQALTRDLDLAPAQQDSVRGILARRAAAMDSLWRDVGPRFETLKSTVRSDIRAQLNPDQQRKYADMNKRFDAKRAEQGGPRERR